MRDFKFFQSERVFTNYMDQMDDYFLGGIVREQPVDRQQLRRYHNRLLDRYVTRFNLQHGQSNYTDARLIHTQVNDFINNNHITTYNEIRSYYELCYQHLLNGENIVSDDDHREYVRMVTRAPLTRI